MCDPINPDEPKRTKSGCSCCEDILVVLPRRIEGVIVVAKFGPTCETRTAEIAPSTNRR